MVIKRTCSAYTHVEKIIPIFTREFFIILESSASSVVGVCVALVVFFFAYLSVPVSCRNGVIFLNVMLVSEVNDLIFYAFCGIVKLKVFISKFLNVLQISQWQMRTEMNFCLKIYLFFNVRFIISKHFESLWPHFSVSIISIFRSCVTHLTFLFEASLICTLEMREKIKGWFDWFFIF